MILIRWNETVEIGRGIGTMIWSDDLERKREGLCVCVFVCVFEWKRERERERERS